MADTKTILIIGLILIVALTLLSGANFGQIGLDDFLGADGESDAGMQLTIYYADGTTREVKTTKSLVPLTIMDGGREVTRVHLETFVTATFTGTVTAWNIWGGQTQCWMTTLSYMQIGSAVFDETWGLISGATWTSGEEKHLFDRDLGASLIEQHLVNAGRPEGRYKLKFDTQFLKLAVSFDDGSTDDRTPNLYTISWEFDYSTAGIESVYITVTSEPWF